MSRRHIRSAAGNLKSPRPKTEVPKGERGIRPAIPLVLIALAALAAFANSFDKAFLLDDQRSIVENDLIRGSAPLWELLHTRRPVVTLSLALNHALGGFDVDGYHAFNLIIHILAAFALFGVVRRTLMLVSSRSQAHAPWSGGSATWTSAAVALIWTVHPLQTQSVTYIIQRGESLMGLFYLLTIYCLIRGATTASKGRIGWYVLCVVCCGLGMGSKAVMVTAPIVALLYDRVFIAGSIQDFLRRRGALYAGLAATWGVLVFCGVTGAVLSSQHKGIVNVGFSLRDVTPAEYALSQPGVILHYLRLALWPYPQCLDYAWPVARGFAGIVLPLVIVALLLAVTLWTLWRRPALGFVGMWFWLILAPTSSIVPIRDLAFEHRMYLPLAAVIVLIVLGGRALIARIAGDSATMIRRLGMIATVAVLVPLTIATHLRNRDYESELIMWGDVVAKRPDNPRARNNYGLALLNTDRARDAAEQLHIAVQLDPRYDAALNNYGLALEELGRRTEAIEQYRRAVEVNPRHHRAHNNLANAQIKAGDAAEALANFERALAIKPDYEKAHNNYGMALTQLGRLDEAMPHLLRAIEIDPGYAEAYANLGNAYAQQGEVALAEAQYRRSIELDPTFAPAHNNLGSLLARRGEFSTALSHFERATRIDPTYSDAAVNMARALIKLNRINEAADVLRDVLNRDPQNPAARGMLAGLSNPRE